MNALKKEILGNLYEIESTIGEGGMGTVYCARHISLRRKVAIKVLHPKFAQNQQFVSRFKREAEIAASLEHDNICGVTDIGLTKEGVPFLVMPLLSGTPLNLLIDEKKMSPKRAVDIVIQVLSALSVTHDAKIIHRDLKPDNIFITQVGDRKDFVKLLDFGICKITTQDSSNALTHTGTVLGTPYYMSPEQARGSKDIDHRADLYSMGVILYEILTQTRPFTGNSYAEIMFNIATKPFTLPRKLNPQIPEALESAILTAMNRSPKDRFQSATLMIKVLQNAVNPTNVDLINDENDEIQPSVLQKETHADKNKPIPSMGILIAVVLLIVSSVLVIVFLTMMNKFKDLAPIATIPLQAGIINKDAQATSTKSKESNNKKPVLNLILPADHQQKAVKKHRKNHAAGLTQKPFSKRIEGRFKTDLVTEYENAK